MKQHWILKLAAVLLILVMYTTHLCSNLYARYITYASSGDETRVATFVIDDGNLFEEGNYVFTTDSSFKDVVGYPLLVTVENKSEVAVEYTLKVETNKNLPLLASWSQEAEYVPLDSDILSNTYNVGVNSGEKTHTLYVTWDETKTDYKYSYEFDVITISIECKQVD